MMPGIPERIESHPENPSVTGHPSLPDTEKHEWIVKKTFPVVKEQVSKAPTQKDSKKRPHRNEISDLRWEQIRISEYGKAPVKEYADQKPRKISHSVPADSQTSPQMDQERTEVMDVIGKQHLKPYLRRSRKRAISLTGERVKQL